MAAPQAPQAQKKKNTAEVIAPRASSSKRGSLALAIPGSFVTTAQNPQTKTLLAGQLARTAALFGVDEIVIYDEDSGQLGEVHGSSLTPDGQERNDGLTEPHSFLHRLLTYIDTPPYLRPRLFQPHKDLRHVGLLRHLPLPHHGHEKAIWAKYREVVPFTRDQTGGSQSSAPGGPGEEIGVLNLRGTNLPAERVTVRQDGEVWTPVSRQTPREDLGCYWGYTVRLAKNLSSVFTECPLSGGYDATIGVDFQATIPAAQCASKLPQEKHLLVVFGGSRSLAHATKQDPALKDVSPEALFDHWISPLQHQALQTPALDETVLMTLAQLQNGLPKLA